MSTNPEDLRAAPLHLSCWAALLEAVVGAQRRGGAVQSSHAFIDNVAPLVDEFIVRAPAESVTARTVAIPLCHSDALRIELHAQTLQVEHNDLPSKTTEHTSGFHPDFDFSRFSDLAEILANNTPNSIGVACLAVLAVSCVPSAKRKSEVFSVEKKRKTETALLVALSGSLSRWRWRYSGGEVNVSAGWTYFPPWVSDAVTEGVSRIDAYNRLIPNTDLSIGDAERKVRSVLDIIAANGTARAVCVPLPLLAYLESVARSLNTRGNDVYARDLNHCAVHSGRCLLALSTEHGVLRMREGWRPSFAQDEIRAVATDAVSGMPVNVDCEVLKESMRWEDLK